MSRRALFFLLAFALVAAQSLALMHRIVHGPQAELPHALALEDTEDACDHAPGWLAGLFAGHDAGDDGCRLLAALSHDGVPFADAAASLPLATAVFLKVLHGDFVARWSALFDARGPPFAHS